ncbi:MAG TPA: peptide chain release factor 3 [Candidatus Binatia bacterium]|nr:peptide chain release factor 3 [Candidatus Binatia bacterium]
METSTNSAAAIALVADEVRKRRTFAIIAHPDAGKTTLTESLLLAGGAIRLAGQVKSRGNARRARSDWLKIEQERGISVTSAVMTFQVGDVTLNLLDTPGHEDFSEDTYRTLTAADSAIMVLDAAKGIEPQTLKLFEVCRLRNVPILTFINKIDREGLSPFELLDEIASKLALDVAPMSWPAGMGGRLRGIFDLTREHFVPFDRDGQQREAVAHDALAAEIGAEEAAELLEEVELARHGYPAFDVQQYLEGHQTPVYFGSALRAFGVRETLAAMVEHAPSPRPQPTTTRIVEAHEPRVSGFVFKVQANMDVNHRDRVAFFRLCSGRFTRGMRLRLSSSGKTISVRNPILFFAQDRELVDEALAGDVIGIPNHGTIRVGDTLTEGEPLVFTGIPNFAPEILMRLRLDNPLKSKQLKRALQGFAEEGVVQIFRPRLGAQWIIGAVGRLQLDVLAARMEAEYDIKVGLEAAPYETARWISSADPAELKRFQTEQHAAMADDRDESPIYLARNDWELGYTMKKWPAIHFAATRERIAASE